MIAYASRTGTRRNLKTLKELDWRLMLSPAGVWNNHGFPYALDNGAWTSHTKNTPFDRTRFLGLVEKFGEYADFVVIPDIVGGGKDSLSFSREWIPELSGMARRLYLAVQDGMTPREVRDTILAWPKIVGIFVGGSTGWKVATTPTWAQFAKESGIRVHVGRVNTKRRVDLCACSGVDSFDGSGPSRFQIHAKRMDAWRRQLSLHLAAPPSGRPS
jgi:hypothetical protein